MGLVTYNAKFLPNVVIFIASLYELLKRKLKLIWETKQKDSFTKLKVTLKNSSLLMNFDNLKEVVLACDAILSL